jgi:hypothetical protein
MLAAAEMASKSLEKKAAAISCRPSLGVVSGSVNRLWLVELLVVNLVVASGS